MELMTILIVFIIISIVISFSIGSNDETFSTIYGSRILSMKKILILTTIFAILGAVVLGGSVSKTVGTGIIQSVDYSIVATILISTACWLIFSSILKFPISTTHSTIGAIIGVGLFNYGLNGINWPKIVEMSIWWIFSPIIGYVVSYLTYKLIHLTVLNKVSGLKNIERVEKIFSYVLLGVISITAFSRAGNDCSNAVGILAGIQNGGLDFTLLLLIAGISFSFGIIILGRGVIKSVGTLTELFPSTAFASEIPTAIILFIGTYLGIPLSGSHMLIGSLLGLSKARRSPSKRGVWKLVLIWLLTFPVAAFLAIIIYIPINYLFNF